MDNNESSSLNGLKEEVDACLERTPGPAFGDVVEKSEAVVKSAGRFGGATLATPTVTVSVAFIGLLLGGVVDNLLDGKIFGWTWGTHPRRFVAATSLILIVALLTAVFQGFISRTVLRRYHECVSVLRRVQGSLAGIETKERAADERLRVAAEAICKQEEAAQRGEAEAAASKQALDAQREAAWSMVGTLQAQTSAFADQAARAVESGALIRKYVLESPPKTVDKELHTSVWKHLLPLLLDLEFDTTVFLNDRSRNVCLSYGDDNGPWNVVIYLGGKHYRLTDSAWPKHSVLWRWSPDEKRRKNRTLHSKTLFLSTACALLRERLSTASTEWPVAVVRKPVEDKRPKDRSEEDRLKAEMNWWSSYTTKIVAPILDPSPNVGPAPTYDHHFGGAVLRGLLVASYSGPIAPGLEALSTRWADVDSGPARDLLGHHCRCLSVAHIAHRASELLTRTAMSNQELLSVVKPVKGERTRGQMGREWTEELDHLRTKWRSRLDRATQREERTEP